MLLENLGVDFAVEPSSVDEAAVIEEDPAMRAQILGRLKAQDVAARIPGRWVIGCDTLVVAADGTLLEKPQDAADARRMLELQSGKASLVHSGLCLVGPDGAVHEGLSSSSVFFQVLAKADTAWWLSTGNWQGRSGAFQIDGPGQLLIERIEGDWSGIVGLPIFLLGQHCAKAGAPLRAASQSI